MRVGSFARGFALATLLAGCASEQMTRADAPVASTADMSGRWVLSAPNAPTCGLNFTIRSGALQGLVEPEGGCPGKLFMSRRWQLTDGKLMISDNENAPLAHFVFINDSFQGQSSDGVAISLMR
jgi:hypothetical protein